MRHVGLCGLARVMSCVQQMGVGSMCVMSRRVMMTRGVVSSRFLVMLRSLFVMLGGLHMMGMCRMGV